MPSMFGRRRGSSANPPVDRNTGLNATAAASSAFLSTSKSNPALSSAAAAAALRSHTTSPEPVGNIQTKRMVRRGSASSNGSTPGGRSGSARPALQRSNSNGSLTERTFRTPSPAQANGARSPSSDAPPVPPIPSNAHQRASSMEPLQRVVSPSPEGAKRGSSVDRGPSRGTPRQPPKLSNVDEGLEAEEQSASPLRNFSRPMSPSQSSPSAATPAKKYTHKSGSWFTESEKSASPSTRPTTSDGLPSTKTPGTSTGVPLGASKSVKKHRITSSQGSHLARSNSTQSRSSMSQMNTTSGGSDSTMVFDPNTRTFIQRPKDPEIAPPSPVSPKQTMVYDKNTRSFVTQSEADRDSSRPASALSDAEPAPSAAQSSKKNLKISPVVANSIESPATSPRHSSPSSANRGSPRAATMLQKQPSVVREDPQAEQQAEASDKTAVKPKDAVTTSKTTTTTSTKPSTPHGRTVSLDVPQRGESAARGRNASLSPQRSAHFSPSPILKPERHVPPPRDVSPVKSAMKNSPASSVRTSSPAATFSPLIAAGPPSETSEDATSQDGSAKKKKSARVSFDERAKEVAPPNAAATPQPVSSIEDEDDDGMMKPRPALPSFGSVRPNRVQPEPAEKVTEMPPERHETSNDHAIGGILRTNQTPLPPEVTSKESAGYVSDESSDAEVPAVASAATPKPAEPGAGDTQVKDFAEKSTTNKDGETAAGEDVDVPNISLQPPTPYLEDESKREFADQDDFKARSKARSSAEILLPGGWDLDDEDDDASQTAESTTTARKASAEDSSATQTVTPIEMPVVHASPQELSDISEDSDAEFSDAVEDPEDFDQGGFGSIDAMVEGPVVTPSPSAPKTSALTPVQESEKPATQQTDKAVDKTDNTKATSNDWGEATTYWSQLSKEKREQLEREHLSSEDERPPRPAVSAKKTKPKTKPANAKAAPAPKVDAPPQQSTAQQAMRKSMRAQPGPTALPAKDDGVHMRRSMRDSGGTMGTTMRQGSARQSAPPAPPQSASGEPRAALQKKSLRPASSAGVLSSSAGLSAPPPRPQSAQGMKNQDSSYPSLPNRSASVGPTRSDAPKVSARLQRELAKADDSDSDSSFKKNKKSSSKVDSQGRYSMRRSMRSGSVDSAPAPSERPTSPASERRFSIRSMSPLRRNKTEFDRTTSPKPAARTTLRGPPPSSKGGNKNKLKSSGKSAPAASPAPASRFKSRFADSDDEDEAPSRSFFKSRFADSDDDEPASPVLRPVRGIPRKQGQDDVDSTDLSGEDEEDPKKASKRDKMSVPMVPAPDDVEKAMVAARRNLGMPDEAANDEGKEGATLQKGTLRSAAPEEKPSVTSSPSTTNPASPEKKKRGFMGSILRRNRHSSASVQQVPASNPPPVPESPAVASTQAGEQADPPTPSSPTVGVLNRRNSNQPTRATRGYSDLSTATAPVTGSRGHYENWPLPPPPPIPDTANGADSSRPNTSDGPSPEAIKLARTMRPVDLTRSKSGTQSGPRVRIQAGEEGSEPGEREPKAVYSRRTGKKKKFGKLRKAFGIDD